AFMEQIHRAQFKGLPENFVAIPANQARDWTVERLRDEKILPAQEAGTRPSNALNYDLRVSGKLENIVFSIRMECSDELFGKDSWAAPFQIYAPGNYRDGKSGAWESARSWNFAVKAGDALEYTWPLDNFENQEYQLRVYGPNGFYREFSGNAQSSGLELSLKPGFKLKGKRIGVLESISKESRQATLKENAYRELEKSVQLGRKKGSESLDVESSLGWYDFTVSGAGFSWSFAGRLENGLESISDQLLGGQG